MPGKVLFLPPVLETAMRFCIRTFSSILLKTDHNYQIEDDERVNKFCSSIWKRALEVVEGLTSVKSLRVYVSNKHRVTLFSHH